MQEADGPPQLPLWDPGVADGSHEDEKKLRAESPVMSDCMLKCGKRGCRERAYGSIMGDKGNRATDQEIMGADARSRERREGQGREVGNG